MTSNNLEVKKSITPTSALKNEIILFLKKEWVTVPEAVSFLSRHSLIEFSETDIYKYALSKDLLLSIWLPERTPVEIGEFRFALDKPEIITIKNRLDELRKNNQTLSEDDLAFEVIINFYEKDQSCSYHPTRKNQISFVEDLWDLPMKGGEFVCVERLLKESMGLELEGTVILDGVFASRGKTICKFLDDFEDEIWGDERKSVRLKYHDPERYYPAGSFPKNFKIVLRTSELIRFIKENGIDKDLESISTSETSENNKPRKRLDPVGEIMDQLFEASPNISKTEMWLKIKQMSNNSESPFSKNGRNDAVTYYAGTQSLEGQKDLTKKNFVERFNRFKTK